MDNVGDPELLNKAMEQTREVLRISRIAGVELDVQQVERLRQTIQDDLEERRDRGL